MLSSGTWVVPEACAPVLVNTCCTTFPPPAACQLPSPRKKFPEPGEPEPNLATATVPLAIFDPLRAVIPAPEPVKVVAANVPAIVNTPDDSTTEETIKTNQDDRDKEMKNWFKRRIANISDV